MAEKFIIAADRARLKIYRYAQAPGQFTPSIQPVNPAELLETRRPYPAPEAQFASRHSGAAARSRSFPPSEGVPVREESIVPVADLALQIGKFLEKKADATWDLAAPGAMLEELIDALPEDVRRRLDQVVTKDLVNVPPIELRAHFAL